MKNILFLQRTYGSMNYTDAIRNLESLTWNQFSHIFENVKNIFKQICFNIIVIVSLILTWSNIIY